MLKLKSLIYKGSIKKKIKEISLTAQDENEQDSYIVKLTENALIEHSEYFHDLTKEELKKHRKTKLEKTTIIALKKIVEYVQHGDVKFQNYSEALETLHASDKYKFKALKQICEDYLITTLDTSNVCDIFEVATTLFISRLMFFCLRFIDNYIDDITKERSFLSLKKSTLREIISRNSLNISSEKVIFDAILGWGYNDILKRGLDPNNQDHLSKNILSLLSYVRFSSMSDVELNDQEVNKYYSLLASDEPCNRRRTLSGMSQVSTTTVSSLVSQPRQHITNYAANLNVCQSLQHTVKVGEVFCLRIEILKGTLFFTGVTLAMRAFAPTKDTSCLCVAITVTNVDTSEQVTKRGTFLNTTEKPSLMFPSPLVAKESENIEVALSVKRAENICPFSVANDTQIIMPDCQKVAMKIIPSTNSTDELDLGRCIFNEIEYFF